MGLLIFRTGSRTRKTTHICNSDSVMKSVVSETTGTQMVGEDEVDSYRGKLTISIKEDNGMVRYQLLDEVAADTSVIDKAREMAKKISALISGDVQVADLTDGDIDNYYESAPAQSEEVEEEKAFVGTQNTTKRASKAKKPDATTESE